MALRNAARRAVAATVGALHRERQRDLLEANLGLEPSPVSDAMQTAHAPRQRLPGEDMTVGLGRIVEDSRAGRILWHDGGTGGYSSFIGSDPDSKVGARRRPRHPRAPCAFIGFDPDSKVGVVVLSNAEPLVDYLGFRLPNRAAVPTGESREEQT